MKSEIISIKSEAMAQVMDATSPEELENIRLAYLGRSGKLNLLTKRFKELDKTEIKSVGEVLNETKNILAELITERLGNISDKTTSEWFDPTLPGKSIEIGHKHLITQAIQDIAKIFASIGFVRRRYQEVDWDWYAFEALNFAPNHPARDNWETFWVDAKPNDKLGEMLLTPHTSNGQVREMEKLNSNPPIRMLNISKTYRRQSDVSHTPMFHQFEGLVVDKDISIKHLKGTIEYFVKSYFGKDRVVRLRPHDFEFTEPSFEIDISCDICGGKGRRCKLCKEGWLELAGAGMVHPNVLKAGGIDPTIYSGFAFGAGVERVLMMKQGIKINDLRTLYSTDTRYLKQF